MRITANGGAAEAGVEGDCLGSGAAAGEGKDDCVPGDEITVRHPIE